jgi:aminodeoxyfutalosine deaminase
VTGQPKIELHVHLTPETPRTAADFQQALVAYAAEAAGGGARYVEASFPPCAAVRDGVSWETVFEGYCDGVAEAAERHDIVVRLTPDLDRGGPVEEAEEAARQAVRYADRGVVGIGLVGPEDSPAKPYATAFDLARDGGLGVLPHAGYTGGPDSVREMLALGADRIRHGIRVVDDSGLLREVADRRIVLDVCPISNLRTRAVASLEEHPLPKLVAAGARCSISTDDPAMFGTDLSRDSEAAVSLGLDPEDFYTAGLEGALCSDETKERLRGIGERFDWDGARPVKTPLG